MTCLLTLLALVSMIPASLVPSSAQAELRAFRLKITDSVSGSERQVVTRFDHIQYGMYRQVGKNEVVSIDQTWMCYDRSDYANTLCAAPPQSPVPDVSGGPAAQDRRPATSSPPQR